MDYRKRGRILAGFMSFLVFALVTLTDFPTTAQANLTDQVESIAGTSWQGQPGIAQTTKEIMAWKQAPAKTASTPTRLPVGTSNHSPGTTSPVVQLALSLNGPGSNPAVAVNPLQTGAFPTVGFNFPAIPVTPADFDNLPGQAVPPDPMGAVGPTQFLMLVNGLLRTFDKTTGAPDGVLDINPDLFFAPVMTLNSVNKTDSPRVRYDRLSGRWILLMNDRPGGQAKLPNRILLAVSSNAIITPGTVWHEYFFQPGQALPASSQNLFADYPTLGVDSNALYIGVNLYTINPQQFYDTAAFVVRKSSILGDGPIYVTAFAPLIDLNGDSPFTPQGADNFDAGSTAGYFIGINNNKFNRNQLELRKVTNPGGSNPTLSPNISVQIDPTVLPLPIPHKGNTGDALPPGQDLGKLAALDNRLLNATIRQGHLWTAHQLGVDASGASEAGTADRDGSRWYDLDLATLQITKSGTIYDSTAAKKSYWLPSITLSGQGHAVLGFNAAGPDDYISAGAARLLASATAMQPPQLYITSASAYNPIIAPGATSSRRWGDYSYTSLDPEDNMTFWTIQEFAYSTGAYGLQVAKLAAPPPATPVSATATLQPGLNSVILTITGSSLDGSGFYEPGPGFPRHLTVSIDGEIVVKNIISVTPTSITLAVSSLFALTGPHSVTVTNPDGQTITGSDVINVAAYSCTQPVTSRADDGGLATLRKAVEAADASTDCKTVILNVTGPISLSGSLPVPAGVTITTDKPCSAGKVEIVGPGIISDGLILNGGIFFGLDIHGFNGRQIAPAAGNNHLKCIKAAMT